MVLSVNNHTLLPLLLYLATSVLAVHLSVRTLQVHHQQLYPRRGLERLGLVRLFEAVLILQIC
jgi:hypothetical protein